MKKWLCIAILVFFVAQPSPSVAVASGTGWSPVIVPRGVYRQQIKATPIEMRPNRPFHFYGNTVRRNYYQAPVLPTRTISRALTGRRPFLLGY